MRPRVITLQAEVPMGVFLSRFVDIERFEKCCSECRGYGRTWACPPYDFEPEEIWKAYESVHLYAKKVIVPEEERAIKREGGELAEAYNALIKPVKAALLEELFAMENNTPSSLALSAGGCDICESCTRPDSPCRRPDRMRYSVESIGGDVLGCISNVFKESVQWAENGFLPEHFMIVGALLKGKKAEDQV